MFRMKKKDLALVAFAGGLLAIEMVGLEAAAPAALRSLAGLTGIPVVQSASHTARAATETMLNSFTAVAAQAAVAGVKGAVEGTAERVAVATPGMVTRSTVHAAPRCGFRYVTVTRGAPGAAVRANVIAFEACRTEMRAIRTMQRMERTQKKAAEIERRAIEAASAAWAL